MDTTENETKPEKVEVATEGKRKFTPLLILAIPLSIGSLIWTTFSLLDFFQVGGIDLQTMRFEDLSIIGLSAAATADIAWSATMVAEFRGVRLTRARLGFGGKDKDQKNLLPYIGWAEVFLVTLMLALHGKGMGNGEAAFAAALPILTRLAWMMVISDLKDPSELTEEMKLTIAERQQKAKEMLEEAKATAGEHAAKMEKLRREEEADRIELRRASQAKLERKRAEIEEKKMEQQGNFELKQAEMEGKNNLEELEAHLKTRLQIQKLQSQQEVQLMRLDAENNYAMQAPIFSRSIVGEVVRPSARRAISSGDDLMDEDDEFPSLEGQGLSQTELKQARWALGYYTINARRADGVTKSAFCKANNLHAPRLSEATANFPPEWFMERGLATWTSAQN